MTFDDLLRPGENCWRRSTADRVAFLIDAAAYFPVLRQAALRAERSLTIVGWDFDRRAFLDWPDAAAPDLPNELGAFLVHLARRDPALEIRVLVWDAPLLYSPEREWPALLRFAHRRIPNLHYVADSAHPLGGSHHQKLVIVDNRLAFAGGLDLTRGRLDSPRHPADDPRRRNADGSAYGPYHDVQVAVSGAPARDLAEVAGMRWTAATGEAYDTTPADADPWPGTLAADMCDVDVAIARTLPHWRGRHEVREVERLYIDMIAAARRTVYIENQYLSAGRVADAMCGRLAEPDGPEIVILLPRDCAGWLEESTMGMLRDRVVARLRRADRHDRLRLYAPVADDHEADKSGTRILVHAKLMIVDDRLVRVGSANLNNRSMGLDTELDLVFDVPAGAAPDALDLRHRLLAEHLGTTPDAVADAVADHDGSLIGAIEALRRESGRTLAELDITPVDPDAPLAVDAALLDPDGAALPERIAESHLRAPDAPARLRRNLAATCALVVAIIALAVAWRWGPLAELDIPALFGTLSSSFGDPWELAAVIVGCFVVGSLVVAPLVLMVLATGMVLDPLPAFAAAFCGAMLGALAGYALGRAVGSPLVRRIAGRRFDRLGRSLSRRGIVAVIVARNLPVAPFTMVNLAAGAARLPLRAYLIGSALGMLPGLVAMTLLANRVSAALRAPDLVNLALLGFVVALLAFAAWWLARRFGARRRAAGIS